MKIADAWKVQKDNATRLSEVLRNAGIGTIAIIWALTTSEKPLVQFPRELVAAGALVALGLILDILQYAFQTAAWHVFCVYKEWALSQDHPADIQKQDEAEFLGLHWTNVVGYVCFWAKCGSVLSGCAALLWFLWNRFVAAA